MRRMNSMLLGHQGASGRTDCVYFWIASRVAGSSHDSGRCTMRDAHLDVVGRRQRRLDLFQRRQQPLARQAPVVVVHLQRADPGRDVDDPGQRARRQRLHQRVHAEAQRQIQHRRPVLDQQVGVAVLADDDGRAARDRARWCARIGDERRPRDGSSAYAARRAASRSSRSCDCSRRRASTSDTGTKRTVSSALSWPIFHSRASMIVAGQTKPPRLGPSGPRMIGMSPVKSIAADRVGVVVDVGRMQARLAAVGARPARLRADQTDAGAARVVVDLPRRPRTGRRCPPR